MGYGGRPSVAGFIEDLKEFGDKAGDSVGDRQQDRKGELTGVLNAPTGTHARAYGGASAGSLVMVTFQIFLSDSQRALGWSMRPQPEPQLHGQTDPVEGL
ncbi:hypothetical protein CJF41_12080 [Pseudomonas lundensis]|nr:hypothetical protein AYO71_08830 [Pseudomonas koreensis]OZY46000.1 hypothetical protein CJF41_12080 [Pseudomonas lundensis]